MAQNSNGIPIIVHRVYRYSGHAQPLGGTAANLPPPPPSEEDALNDPKEKKLQEITVDTGKQQTWAPPRRADKREREREQPKSLFVVDAANTNKTDPELKKWGWLAEESDANRQVLASYRKPDTDEESRTNSLAGQSETNAAKRAALGSLKGNAYEPVGSDRSQVATSNVDRVVQDHIARAAEQRKQEEAKQKAEQKESQNLVEKHDLPPMLSTTNETLGLARSHKDDEHADGTLDADFSQTRKAMAGITDRYQLNLTMADMVRRSSAPPPEANAGKTLTSRYAVDRDGTMSLASETRRPAGAPGNDSGGVAQPAGRAPAMAATTMSGSGASWMKPPSGSAPPAFSASASVEGPKIPKAADMQGASTFTPPAPPPSASVNYAPQPAYTPVSTLPSYYTPGGHGVGGSTPAFKPTAPYKSLFDTPSSR